MRRFGRALWTVTKWSLGAIVVIVVLSMFNEMDLEKRFGIAILAAFGGIAYLNVTLKERVEELERRVQMLFDRDRRF